MSNKHPSEEWEEELKEAPILGSIQRDPVFEVPEGYFERTAESLQFRIEEQELQYETPTLHRLPKKNVFQTPPHYFETFPQRMQEVLSAQEASSSSMEGAKVVRFFRPRYLLAIAAAVSLLILIRIWPSPAPQTLDLGDIPVEELMASVQWDDISSETLLEVLGEENLSDEAFEAPEIEDDMSDLLQELDDTELENMFLDI